MSWPGLSLDFGIRLLMRKAFLFLVLIPAPVLLLGAMLAGAAGARAPRPPLLPAPQWGRDIPVNQFPLPRPTISAARNPMLAIRPGDPNVVIAGYDSQEEALLASGYARSTDAGQTWTSGRFTGPWGDQGMIPFGNVSVAYDGFGT